MNHAVRIGDTVHRRAQGHPLLHAYLRFLEYAGMSGVPRFLGIDAQGCEVLSFVPGETAQHDDLFGDASLHSDRAIADMARFLRKLHDVSADFLPMALENGWTNPQQPPGVPYETICHDDAAIWNFSVVDGRISGLFDFDQACPGTRAWDLTLPLFSAVLPSCYEYDSHRHADDTRRRVRLFFDAYGMACPHDIVAQAADRVHVWCDEEAARGAPNEHYRHVEEYLRAHAYDWV